MAKAPAINPLYALLEAAPASEKAQKDPIATFIGAATEQKEKAKRAIAALADGVNIDTAKTTNGEAYLSPKGDWFVRRPGGWAVKFSRYRIATPNGTSLFQAESLEQVIQFLDAAIELAKTDDAFKKQITDKSNEFRANLAKGRK